MGFLQPSDEILQLTNGVGIQQIINPPPFGAVYNRPGVFQDSQMKRQPRLTGLKGFGQIADTLLSFSQSFQYANPCFIRKRMEKTDRLFSPS